MFSPSFFATGFFCDQSARLITAATRFRAQAVSRKIVVDALVRAVLFENLQYPRVLLIAGREYLRRLTREEEGSVRAMTINHAANDEHASPDDG